MKVLLIGTGGREHALAWAIAKSPRLDKLYLLPGNAGMSQLGEITNIDAGDIPNLIAFAKDNAIDLVVIGPEAPLVLGLVDQLEKEGIAAFGPSASAARLEGSKAFTKQLCRKYDIPTAAYKSFIDPEDAKRHVRSQSTPIVIKADGLAGGKGVVIAQTHDEACEAIDHMFDGRFGVAGQTVIIEEFMSGEEASFFVLTDGINILPLTTAQDHKRVGEGDTGPNTGGMGAYSPAPIMTNAIIQKTMEDIIRPTVRGMAAAGCPYKGVLYAGLMVTDDGPTLVEYNCRFGDPECQAIIPRLKSDILDLLEATAKATLHKATAVWSNNVVMNVVMATRGYPGSYKKGSIIRGVPDAEMLKNVIVFHAGTRSTKSGLEATGGRVLNVTASGDSVTSAAERVYKAIDKIDWPDGFYRSDIGWRAIQHESQS